MGGFLFFFGGGGKRLFTRRRGLEHLHVLERAAEDLQHREHRGVGAHLRFDRLLAGGLLDGFGLGDAAGRLLEAGLGLVFDELRGRAEVLGDGALELGARVAEDGGAVEAGVGGEGELRLSVAE
jgi:hypothetical protein